MKEGIDKIVDAEGNEHSVEEYPMLARLLEAVGLYECNEEEEEENDQEM